MDLNELQSVQSRERQTDSLQQLRATFYQDAADYIQDLEDERDAAAERADDPWNAPEVGRLNDDIDTAKGTVEAIYERRVGKIVKMASLAAADMPTEDEGLTEEEQALFDQLVAAIEQNREGVFAILDGEEPAIDPTGGELSAGTGSPPTPGTDTGTGPKESTASAPSSTDETTPPTGVEEQPTPAADEGHRQVPPDLGRQDGVSEGDHEPADDGTPEPSVGAADLMGSGGDGSSGTAGDSIDEPSPDDAGPSETDQLGADPKSTEPPVEDVQGGDAGTGQAVRDGGAVESRPTESTSATGSDGPRAGATEGATATDPAPSEADPGPGDADSGSSEAEPDVDRAMVRITDDVGPIYGVEGREYDLTTDDVVTLPEANVGPLLKQGAAERID